MGQDLQKKITDGFRKRRGEHFNRALRQGSLFDRVEPRHKTTVPCRIDGQVKETDVLWAEGKLNAKGRLSFRLGDKAGATVPSTVLPENLRSLTGKEILIGTLSSRNRSTGTGRLEIVLAEHCQMP